MHPAVVWEADAECGSTAGPSAVDRLVRNYPFAEVNFAIADSQSGATIKPVLTFS